MNLKALFLVALLGLLAAIGVALSAFGWVVTTGYAATVVVVLAVLARRARHRLPSGSDDGRTCSCCTSTVFDPVEVI